MNNGLQQLLQYFSKVTNFILFLTRRVCVSRDKILIFEGVYCNRGGSRIFFRRGYTSTSTPINHIVFWGDKIPVVLENPRSSQGGGGLCTPCILPLDPPLCKLYFLAVCNTTKNKSAGISQTKSKGTTL